MMENEEKKTFTDYLKFLHLSYICLFDNFLDLKSANCCNNLDLFYLFFYKDLGTAVGCLIGKSHL